jgi:hypothetical protein
MEDIVNFLRAWIMVFALILFIVSMVAYRRTKSKRVLIVSIAFGIFFVKGIVLSLGLLYPDIESINSGGLGDFLDVLILALLAISILKR